MLARNRGGDEGGNGVECGWGTKTLHSNTFCPILKRANRWGCNDAGIILK